MCTAPSLSCVTFPVSLMDRDSFVERKSHCQGLGMVSLESKHQYLSSLDAVFPSPFPLDAVCPFSSSKDVLTVSFSSVAGSVTDSVTSFTDPVIPVTVSVRGKNWVLPVFPSLLRLLWMIFTVNCFTVPTNTFRDPIIGVTVPVISITAPIISVTVAGNSSVGAVISSSTHVLPVVSPRALL